MTKIVQLPAIANEGRFGNRLIHYIVGKCHAESIGATVQIPRRWVGETIFEINEPYIDPGHEAVVLPPFFNLPHRLVDPCLTRKNVKRLLKWRKDFLRVTDKKEAAIHLRRGDFLHLADFPVVPRLELLNSVKRVKNIKSPHVVSESEPSRTGLFSKALSFLEDFQTLMMAENVFVYPRSTFSQMAALLGDGNIYMPYDYGKGHTSCKFRLADPEEPVIFPTKNNSLP